MLAVYSQVWYKVLRQLGKWRLACLVSLTNLFSILFIYPSLLLKQLLIVTPFSLLILPPIL